ncbi:M20 family metallo-hydrolase [Halobium salinum]|uniref:M20 family metallo-hydrolase n=1 Tax=Halobium salinum TaxID=1364940 RepID=A0ABD5PAZ3_9EURY|nr:M20 family metallo-hydrolase [Halobium salinum]
MPVREARLRDDLEANGSFGAVEGPGHGRTVLTGSDADRAARDHFVDRLEDAGLAVRVDAVGNVVGRYTPDDADPTAAPVAAGSHLDSVPEGGIFDGPLGVYAALEAVRALKEDGADLARPVEVVNLTEEEGQRFGGGLVGSSVAAGDMSLEAALSLEDDGETLEEALAGIGYQGDGVVDASEWDAWLELHIEQGERLETAGVPAGVVTSITGLTRCAVEIGGEADHAGTTPMGGRTDALAAASEFVLDVERAAEARTESSASAVGTVGHVEAAPNAPNVIPGRVDLTVDVRDVEYDSVETIVAAARDSLDRLERERGVETSLDRPWDRRPVPMSDRVREAFHVAGADRGIDTADLHSGAAHDTMHFANATDAGLLFAPSRDGLSHTPREWTDWADCAAAAEVLAGAVAELASD